MKYVLFDLDGTLLPMDQNTFVNAYFKELAKKLAPHGYTADALVKAVWNGTGRMQKNDGSSINEDVFWNSFSEDLGEGILEKRPVFDEFYLNEFNNIRKSCGFTPRAKETVDLVGSLGGQVAIATLPVFPATAIEARIRWAGINPEELALYTCYENCRFTKPNPMYYNELLSKLSAKADECIMVGNSVDEDMAAANVGMKVFLLTDCLINENGTDISGYPQGGWDELQSHIKELFK